MHIYNQQFVSLFTGNRGFHGHLLCPFSLYQRISSALCIISRAAHSHKVIVAMAAVPPIPAGISPLNAFAATFPASPFAVTIGMRGTCPCPRVPTEAELYAASELPTFVISSVVSVTTSTLDLSPLGATMLASEVEKNAAISGVKPLSAEMASGGVPPGLTSTYVLMLTYPKVIVSPLGVRMPIPQVVMQCGSKAEQLTSMYGEGESANAALVASLNTLLMPQNKVLSVQFSPFACQGNDLGCCCAV
jgi:hypothetical protein